MLQCPSAHWSLKKKRNPKRQILNRENGFIFFSCTSSKSQWVTAFLLLISRTTHLQYPVGISPEKEREHTEAANSNYHESKWIYYHTSHSYSVFFISRCLGATLAAFPTRLHYTQLVSWQAKQNNEGGTVIMRQTITKQRMERWQNEMALRSKHLEWPKTKHCHITH